MFRSLIRSLQTLSLHNNPLSFLIGPNEPLKSVIFTVKKLINTVPVEQDQPLGLGHAVGLAEAVLDDDEDVIAVMLPDDLVLPFGVTERMRNGAILHQYFQSNIYSHLMSQLI